MKLTVEKSIFALSERKFMKRNKNNTGNEPSIVLEKLQFWVFLAPSCCIVLFIFSVENWCSWKYPLRLNYCSYRFYIQCIEIPTKYQLNAVFVCIDNPFCLLQGTSGFNASWNIGTRTSIAECITCQNPNQTCLFDAILLYVYNL